MDHIDDEEEEEEFCEYCGEPLEYGLCTGNCEQSLIENGLDDDEGIIFLLLRYFHANEDKLKKEGVDVKEWDEASKGKKLPERKSKKRVKKNYKGVS